MEFCKYDTKPVSNRQVLRRQVHEQSDVCDVTIQVGEWEKRFHWCVLEISPFFKNLRKHSFMEKQTGIIKLNVATPLATQAAIMYLYGRKPIFTQENISEVLELSEFLMIPNLKSSCVQYIKAMPVTIDNCIQLLELSCLYGFDLSGCYEYIRSHLDDVLQRKEAMNLTKEFVIELLTDPYMSYVSSEVRFSFLANWSKTCQKNEVAFQEVFDCIDLEAMDKSFFKEEVCKHPLVSVTCDTSKLAWSSDNHSVLIFSNSIKDNKLACFDIDKEKWCGIATPLTDNPYNSAIYFKDSVNRVRSLTVTEIYRVANYNYSSFGVCIHTLQSKKTSAIQVSANEKQERFACVFTNGDILTGVTNKETVITHKTIAIQAAPLFKRRRGFQTVSGQRFSRYESKTVEYSTLFYGHLESPKTQIDSVVTIKGTCISSCCVNSEHCVGLFSEKEKALYIYDLENCKIDTIQLKPHIHFSGRNAFNLVSSEEGFILYNDKNVGIVSRSYGLNLADNYAVQKIDLEHDIHWKKIEYFYCDAGKSWFRFLKRTDEDELEFASVSHKHLLEKSCQKLVWKPLPLTQNLPHLTGSAFMVQIHRSLLKCHVNCPHCEALKSPKTYQTIDPEDEDDYFGPEFWKEDNDKQYDRSEDYSGYYDDNEYNYGYFQ